MTEKIREGIAKAYWESNSAHMAWEKITCSKDICYTFADQIIKFLDENDVRLIDKDRELPFISLEDATNHDSSEPWCAGNFTDSLQEFGRKAQQDMFKAGAVFTKRLIE